MRTAIHAILMSIFLTVTAPGWAQAAPTCGQLFESKHLAYGSIDPEFQWNRNYTRELKVQSPVKDQCALATCHIQSWVSEMEHNYETSEKKPIQLSTEYMTIMTWVVKAVQLLHDGSKKTYVNLASDPIASLGQIRRFGIMPAGIWKAKVDVTKKSEASRIAEFIANIIGRAKWDRKRAKSQTEKEQINEAAQAEIYKIFNDIAGDFPSEFVFEGVQYTPESFFQRWFGIMEAPITTLTLKDGRRAANLKYGSDEDVQIIKASIDDIESVAKQLIDTGENVFLGFEANQTFIDDETGLMSIQAYIKPRNGEPMSRTQRSFFGVEDGGHAVQIVGYEADANGRILKWKIKNSWGTKSGDGGYYHMHRDYFRAFARQITFFNDRRLKLPDAQQAPSKAKKPRARRTRQLEFQF